MFGSGLLILTSSKFLSNRLQAYLKVIKQQVNSTLYIKFKPRTSQSVDAGYIRAVPLIYNQASIHCSELDVRILQGSFKSTNHLDLHIHKRIEVVYTDNSETGDLNSYLKSNFNIDHEKVQVIAGIHSNNISSINNDKECGINDIEVFDNVVLGGTFDRLHNGHKVLLGEAISRCRKKLTIGITDGNMIESKVLWELIQPAEKRVAMLKHFLEDVDPTLEYLIVPIFDPFGPAIIDPDLNCIVASQETERGALKVNEKREEKGLSTLVVHIINLIEDAQRSKSDEMKISSSTVRKRLLGTYYKGFPKPKVRLPAQPHLIGLTGGIASGKSAIGKDLVDLGAGLVDCDKLAHKAYEPGQPVYEQIIARFGKDILNSDLTINRKVLGVKVFGNEENRLYLNSLVWPAVQKMVEKQVQDLFMEGKNLIVLEVALLIEAGWEDHVHEVWVSIISEKEAVRRIGERDNLTEELALQRIKSQASNSKRVSKADIVFSSLWDRTETKRQVATAWKLLNERLQDLRN